MKSKIFLYWVNQKGDLFFIVMKTLDLYITKLCNLNCEYCYVDLEKKEEWFDLHNFTERVNLLDYDHIKFFGWEPLIKWQEIQKIVNLLEWKNKKFTIVTNWLLLDENKLKFCIEKGVEVVISMHFKSVKSILTKLHRFLFAKHILWFSFIFEENKLSFPRKIISYLLKIWFKNFILTPEVYWNWDGNKLHILEKELYFFIQLYENNRDIKFTWPSSNNLIKLIKWCTKNIYTKEWDRKICNRFKSLEKIEWNILKNIYKDFNEIIDYDNNPNKWFYVCPIWWYLDTFYLQKNYKERILQYKDLNEVFLDFYKKINDLNWKINFLTEKIDEIRFNLTSQCNIRCEYCYVDFKNDKLDFSIAKNIIDFFVLKEWQEKTISFFGWEPFLEFDLMKNIVGYAKQKFAEKNKKLHFKIATNFLLINQEKLDFLLENNFEIHISFNWKREINNKMRDNSTDLLLRNFEKYLTNDLKNNVTILFAFSNKEIEKLYENIEFIYLLWFQKIHLEMIFGKKYHWNKEDFLDLKIAFEKIKKSYFYERILFNSSFEEKNILDISVDWKCNDNSLEFHNYEADFKKQKLFQRILQKNFQN